MLIHHPLLYDENSSASSNDNPVAATTMTYIYDLSYDLNATAVTVNMMTNDMNATVYFAVNDAEFSIC